MTDKDFMTTKQMRILEANAEYFGISRLQLMENAGRNVAVEVASRFDPKDSRIAVFCGLGGNGGDGLVAARHLACSGFQLQVMLAGKAYEIVNTETKRNWEAAKSLAGSLSLYEVPDTSLVPDINAEVIIDALIGIGLKGPPRPPLGHLIKRINDIKAFRVAVDVPSGIESDSGNSIGEAVKADLTITFHKKKPCFAKAKNNMGELVVTCIGIPVEIESFAGPGDVLTIVKPRLPEAHKGDFGKILVVGGSETYSGAPALTALAALRTGVDMVTIATPRETAYSISSISPNLITMKLEGDHLNRHNLPLIGEELEKVTAVVVGPGLGLHKETRETVTEVMAIVETKKIPMVLDADGLKAFADSRHRLRTPTILTPHIGEYQVLTGEKLLEENHQERVKSVMRSAANFNATILLKSHTDIISDGSIAKLNFTGNPGMTVGGTGDVLTGIVAAFLAQQNDPFEAAVAGAFVNGAAGDFVKSEKGFHMTATDLLDWIPKIIDNPMFHLNIPRCNNSRNHK